MTKEWTILNLLTWGTSYLSEKGFSDPRLNIEVLLAHVLHLKRIQLYTNFDRPLNESELAGFKELLRRRLAHEPLQYILGETEFMGFTFTVDKRVLIPRPDTEILVESVAKIAEQKFAQENEIQILEIGTGSGCIAVSLAKLLAKVIVTAVDVSTEALEVAKMNAEQNGANAKINFIENNFLMETSSSQKYHCIVSNPPYISNEEYQLLPVEVKDFEPRNALADGNDGLTFYKAISEKTPQLLIDKGFIAVEHAYNQSDAVQKTFREMGWKNIQTIKDYDGNYRCVIAERM